MTRRLRHASIDDFARPDLFESDDELDDCLADLYASRRQRRVSLVVDVS
ncbi:hypothetical protein [Micromonospora thermarum]|uniref:Uncharacterized protein n=1 Tax=Micromonospora thermarum TaxID=2720024 RepID=A0ABX0YZR8_9ACTN|nr:hypothetical protein [Micromonospora thermarum]NJP30624.1 hypothetical protein [Micromonospora thermarum]